MDPHLLTLIPDSAKFDIAIAPSQTGLFAISSQNFQTSGGDNTSAVAKLTFNVVDWALV